MFWQYQPTLDILYLVTILGWGIVICLVAYTSKLFGLIAFAYQYRRVDNIPLYIARFMPPLAYGLIVELGRAVLVSVILLSGALHWGLLSWQQPQMQVLKLLGSAVLALLLFSGLRHLSYRLWQYVFFDAKEGKLLLGDQLVLTIVMSVCLVPVSLLSLVAGQAQLAVMLTAGVLVLVQIVRLIQTFRRLSPVHNGCLCIFLYLCGHELLPWIYLAALGSWSSSSPFDWKTILTL